MSDRLQEIWAKLYQPVSREAGLRILRLSPDNFHIYAGLVVPAENPAVVLKIPTEELPLDIEAPSSEGFCITVYPETPGRSGVTRITLELRDKQYEEVFVALAQDVYEYITCAQTNADLVRRFYRRLHRWQEFLKKGRVARLSKAEQSGLWGELHFLHWQLSPKIGIHKAVEAWQGPLGCNQDFCFDEIAVEIKVTTSNPHEKVHISNLKQLDPAGLSALYLHHIAATDHHGSGETLVDVIELVRDRVLQAGGATEPLDAKLFEAGYLDSERDYYSKTGYTVLKKTTYSVGDEFPRIKAEEIPSAVGDVKFSLILAPCVNFETNMFLSEE